MTPRRFLAVPGIRHLRGSITWRAILLTSLLLLGLASLFTVISHDRLTDRFAQARQSIYQTRASEIELAIDESAEKLQLLAGMVSASDRLGHAMQQDNGQAAADVLDPLWPTLQLDAGIDEIRVLDSRGKSLTSVGQSLGGNEDQLISDMIRHVMATETPQTLLRCADDCRQYAAVPVLVEGSSVGLVLFSRSLADVTRYLRSMSESEVALLVTNDDANALPGRSERHIAPWKGSLVTLTHGEASLPLLKSAANDIGLSHLLDAPWTFDYQGRNYELIALSIGESSDYSSAGYFLLLSDITDQIADIRTETQSTLLVALSGWLAAEGLLMWILWPPMARLRRLASLLPRLAQRDFPAITQSVHPKQGPFMDETDTLERATLDLAMQLEALERAVSNRDRELTQRLRELGLERDFITGLLDTAHVLILTQDREGRIRLVNQYAESVTGQTSKALLGRRFIDVFMLAEPDRTRPFDRPSQEEGTLKAATQESRRIVWYHAPLPGRDSGDGTLISVGIDITERKIAEERLAWLANRDPLTDLYNRRYFQEVLERTLVPDAHGAVLFLDLDQFKEVNELSGHPAGDQLLRLVARTLEAEIGNEARIARLGGDEFSILIENIDADEATQTAERIVRALETTSFAISGRRHRAIGSMGIALYPEHGTSPADIMASADFAMYRAKESAVQRWYLLSKDAYSRKELQQRVYWVERIREALRTGDFELLLQPIARLDNGETQHFEALLRMHGNDGNYVMPGLFIPIAERSGQIVELDRWVLKESLRLLNQVRDSGISLAVNLSGQSLHDSGLAKFLQQELLASGANPHQLILEVTETAAVTDFSTARGVLQDIRDLGCKAALDDFGVGFSSFHYLAQLPADYIKIDGSFIQKLLDSPEDRLIVRAIADIASGFGKQTIAEFVDNPAMLPILKEYGITYAQGYHIGRPSPAKDILAQQLAKNGVKQ
ncbi:EAL domain-containing protein [Halomonas sp. FL8]|uniref:bifunctional diguanylate cyclase/phosphodiesterase n=1 Tax=Halomonas sp. FL8 TaxID=1904461 RepID=UPI00345F6D5E